MNFFGNSFRPITDRLEFIHALAIPLLAARSSPGEIWVIGVAEGEPMVAWQLALEEYLARIQEKIIVAADLAGVVQIDDGNRHIVKQVDKAPGKKPK